jgi:hypothetical protein
LTFLFPCWLCENYQHTTEPEVVKRQAYMRSWNEQARHQSPGHFGSYRALHLDRAFLRTEGIVSMNDFARKPARQQAIRLSPLSAFIRRVCYMLAQKGDPS